MATRGSTVWKFEKRVPKIFSKFDKEITNFPFNVASLKTVVGKIMIFSNFMIIASEA